MFIADGSFYKKAASYWAKIPATVDGVLGGYGNISDIDINGSKALLDQVFALNPPPGIKLALDCGAGIGRISKLLLMERFDKVDLIEQDEKFINTAKQSIGADNSKLGTLYQVGLQHFEFEVEKLYDVIWCQWVVGHLDDYDFAMFLKKSISALATDGVIVVKDNVSNTIDTEYDDQDSSITRPLSRFKDIFEELHLNILITDIEKNFPNDIYPVHAFVLRPCE